MVTSVVFLKVLGNFSTLSLSLILPSLPGGIVQSALDKETPQPGRIFFDFENTRTRVFQFEFMDYFILRVRDLAKVMAGFRQLNDRHILCRRGN